MATDDTTPITTKRPLGPAATHLGVKWMTLVSQPTPTLQVNYAAFDETLVDGQPARVEVAVLPTVTLSGAGLVTFFATVAAAMPGAAGATAGERLRAAWVGTLNALGRQRFDI